MDFLITENRLLKEKLGIQRIRLAGAETIKRILLENRIDPAPVRGKRMPWTKFIQAHFGSIAVMDFFAVETMTLFGMVRYHVLFIMDIATCSVEIAGKARDPDGHWMEQMARHLIDFEDGFLRGKCYLIVDRDPLYTASFRRTLKSGGVNVLKLPPRSPNLNAFAERFVLSIKSEVLNRVIPLSESHLRHAISEYMLHYLRERNHQGLDNALISPVPAISTATYAVTGRQRLGGLLNFYHRDDVSAARS